MKETKTNYRKIWEQVYGPIPKDLDGRPYEIHHIDGNHKNNSIENLKCLTIKEHYDAHYNNGDYGACVMIAKRMGLPKDYISNIQKGTKRPGIGGVKKGTIPWNKNKSGYKLNTTEEGKIKRILAVKKRAIISDEAAEQIRKLFLEKVEILNDNIGKTMKNGLVMSYERAFCLEYSKKYKVSDQYIYRILRGKSKIV
jgi:hypothetical protein